jgi:hypothetical protein
MIATLRPHDFYSAANLGDLTPDLIELGQLLAVFLNRRVLLASGEPKELGRAFARPQV